MASPYSRDRPHRITTEPSSSSPTTPFSPFHDDPEHNRNPAAKSSTGDDHGHITKLSTDSTITAISTSSETNRSPPKVSSDDDKVSYWDLPVQQIAILSICRFSEPLALTGVFPYLPEMIRSFGVPEDSIPAYAGMTSAVFSGSQCLTAIWWGRASDRFGRKPVILICSFGVMLSSLLFGFSQTLAWAIVARAISGGMNGNVGTLRTTVAELVPQKRLQPVAFSIMPLIWSIGSIFGPILGGALSSPAKKYPGLFGDNAFFIKFPFALPNLVAAIFFAIGLTTGFLFLKETLEEKRHERDIGRSLGRLVTRLCGCGGRQLRRPGEHGDELEDYEYSSIEENPGARLKAAKLPPPSYKDVFSKQSSYNLISYFILAMHSVAYDQQVSVFLNLERQTFTESSKSHNPLRFSDGFGLDSGTIGVIFTIVGIVTMIAQFSVFPVCVRRYGTLNCLKWCTAVFPVTYFLSPFAVTFSSEWVRRTAIMAIILAKGMACVFAFPCMTIMLTNSAKSLRLLGTLNGVAVSLSAIGRAIGPFMTGALFTWGVDIGYVIIPWWVLGSIATLGFLSTFLLEEMDGFSSESDKPTAGVSEPVSVSTTSVGKVSDGQDVETAIPLSTTLDAEAETRGVDVETVVELATFQDHYDEDDHEETDALIHTGSETRN